MALEGLTIGSSNATQDPKIKTNFETLSGLLNSENKLGNTLRWQTPKIIATEQTRENVAFGTLTTADEITGVVLPENGLIQIGYVAKWKSSVAAAGRAAIFIGANQLKNTNAAAVQEVPTEGTVFNTLSTSPLGLSISSGETAFVTTGQPVATGGTQGGVCHVFAAAGTYNISLQFKATSGSVTAKERKLWVAVLGV